MHRPLRVPLYLRLWHLIKGVLFYNTVYWDKASDGLKMPSMTRAERENKRPKADLEIIKPRDKPRARLDTFRGAQVSKPDYAPQVSDPAKPDENFPEADAQLQPEEIQDSVTPDGKYIKRRRYKRRRAHGADGGNGFFRRVFGK